ncbi:helix-turn-helix domain-containing protein [Burkholderia ubonensis]|uniref:helix-turn-helix domain-containing protein n=1 Tax=Burkholderia ubonensis TaxID=101571 RepID=UPI000A59DD92|nr:helix-turn-helix transcriptional regulator [Burkholderia ubonensis]
MIEIATVEKRVLADPAARAGYDAQALGFAVARELVAARARAGLTQEQVAERMRTPHSIIAYMESGRTMPSLRTLLRYAKATVAGAPTLASPGWRRNAAGHRRWTCGIFVSHLLKQPGIPFTPYASSKFAS